MLPAEGDYFPGIGDRFQGSRDYRHPFGIGQASAIALGTDGPEQLRRRADPDQPGLLYGLGEGSPFGQKTISGMDRIRPGLSGGLDQGLDIKIALNRVGRADHDRLIGLPDIGGVLIRLGIDGDRGHAHPAAGPDHPTDDLSPVGDEQLTYHRGDPKIRLQ